ncbi:MAG: c-type cytochrome biogenesis protein CcmI [Paracoccaceae bacterium]|nr:c-type cytochrome biogenesis protein CcmI [Paracoccaceae bacterium]
MIFWITLAAAAAIAGFWLARSFLISGGIELAEGEQSISIYRDQMDAVERDARRGLISEVERAEAEREIEGRAVRAAKGIDNDLLRAKTSPIAAIGVFAVALATSGALYWGLGAPGTPDQPLAERRAQVLTQQAEAGDEVAQATLAEQEAAEAPDSFEKWWQLARARTASGDHAAAAEAYRKAAEASNDSPAVLSAYAEALTLANGNKVPPAAKIVLAQVLDRQPLDARARYYSALAKAQAQDFEGALRDWAALYGQSAPDAPWAALVRRDIINMARFTRRPLQEILPDASAEEIALAASEPATQELPEMRIAAIEESLAADPKNFELSIELAALYAGNGSSDKAAAAIDAAKAQYQGAPFVQQRLAATAEELGLGADAESAGRRGPTDDDVAAAAGMTEAERGDMVQGMVSGLAARLEDQPDDLNGWIMLIRSYAVLQDPENAKTSVAKAYAHFDGRPQQRAAIRSIAAEFGIPLL